MSDILYLLQDIRLKKIPETQVTVPPELEALFGKNTNKMCGVSPSDIDKYSRLLFPFFLAVVHRFDSISSRGIGPRKSEIARNKWNAEERGRKIAINQLLRDELQKQSHSIAHSKPSKPSDQFIWHERNSLGLLE
ncbi:gamma-aminobutyric acid receptor subunit beta [Caerostris extrusa]|uniref:Gamma-aminobutyric acid receptor subunit beta n=1 Tax=Caerostris extrusa TaxID=172846 RepID=A0AAV4VHU6_CAEEX|nr:gamma-aminobutyric acid receptor subunit beta [Caerostris extrusa]